jgi:hypothetical protein
MEPVAELKVDRADLHRLITALVRVHPSDPEWEPCQDLARYLLVERDRLVRMEATREAWGA